MCSPAIPVGSVSKDARSGDPSESPRVCPKCHQAAVFQTKTTSSLVVLFVSVAPVGNTSHTWKCELCDWSTPLKEGGLVFSSPLLFLHPPTDVDWTNLLPLSSRASWEPALPSQAAEETST
ncbi:hypothetical protein PUNSTDRAFT_137451 [Punctularia strigosozonata HHB-11173 SS5]|uniref:uncharacterized protein n=1 Tax=Punctularia strigosozonata (strain HHB-11173) TaxID=741275 RepID=UPI0004416476|nr:uncharacterized protein PUNSTDRAFT_137451 [Punctularia strigosozonata HHB-11173 SS5]EIN05338.1 hypothetical protein PUNSTDRAFT_137451 [Punctularia strigosozonata HHB-11173 SS5]